jgi:hypothetical protein
MVLSYAELVNKDTEYKMAHQYYKFVNVEIEYEEFQIQHGLSVDRSRYIRAESYTEGELYYTFIEYITKFGIYANYTKVYAIEAVVVHDYDNLKDKKIIIGRKFEFSDLPEWSYEKQCKHAIQQQADLIQYVKEQTPELCKQAVRINGHAIKFVKPKYQTPDVCELAIRQDTFPFRYISKEKQTSKLCKIVIARQITTLMFINPCLHTKELYEFAVKHDGCALAFMKPELQTYELCKLAIRQNRNALQYVNPEFRYLFD